MADDEQLETQEFITRRLAAGEPLEGILTIVMCEVHNQMPRVESPDYGEVRLGMVRKPAKGIDVVEIAKVVQECIHDPALGAQLLTLALLNMMGAVEWVE